MFQSVLKTRHLVIIVSLGSCNTYSIKRSFKKPEIHVLHIQRNPDFEVSPIRYYVSKWVKGNIMCGNYSYTWRGKTFKISQLMLTNPHFMLL